MNITDTNGVVLTFGSAKKAMKWMSKIEDAEFFKDL